MQKFKIAFFDIDGTLLPPDHHLPESTVAALNILRAKGVQLYLATGRPPYHLHYLKKDLPFEFDGMVMMNGQYCRDKDGCFYAHPLPQEGLRELLPWLEKINKWAKFQNCTLLIVNPGSNNDKLFSLLMAEYRSLFGLASVRDQAGSYLYDIAFWCNEKGVSARQQLTLKHIEGEWHLAQQEETVVQPRSDEKRILSHIAVLEGAPALSENWTLFDSNEALFHEARTTQAATLIFSLMQNNQIETLARQIHTLRRQRGSALKIIVRENNTSLRATDERLQATIGELSDYFAQQPEVTTVSAITGIGGNQGSGRITVRLKPWDERPNAEQSAAALEARASRLFRSRTDARIFVSLPPVVRSLGSASGVSFVIKDMNGAGYEALVAAKDHFISLSQNNAYLRNVRTNNQDARTQLVVDIDNDQAVAHQIEPDVVNRLLSDALGGTYVNDFIHNGRVKRVYIQGDAPFRMQPQHVGEWRVRNNAGEMIPLSMFSSVRWAVAPPQLLRFNGSPAMDMQASVQNGVSSGDAMRAVQAIMAELPRGFDYEWTGASLQEQRAGAQAPLLYVLSMVFVFLCLAALYESWSVPLAVILAAALGLFGALAATSLRGLNNDVFFQVGLLTTVGLASKNAILIVEFAVQLQQKGRSLTQAAIEAARLRLRPIIMTSLAFGFGVLPLALGSGAGAAGRIAIGTAVLGGTIISTLLGLLFVPLFFVWVRSRVARRKAV